MPGSDLISGYPPSILDTTYIENGKGIFGFFQRLSVVGRNIGFVTAESNARSIADGEGETESHELASISTRQRLRMWKYDIAHPCDNDSIVVIAHSLHHTHARDESQHDNDSGNAEQCYHDCKHCRSTILHGQDLCVHHDCSRHSSSA